MLKIQRLLLYSVEDIIMAALHGLGFQVAATGGGNVSAKISICCLRKDTLFDEHFTRIINPKTHLVTCRSTKVSEFVATGMSQGFATYVCRSCPFVFFELSCWPKLGLVASREGRLFQLFEIQGNVAAKIKAMISTFGNPTKKCQSLRCIRSTRGGSILGDKGGFVISDSFLLCNFILFLSKGTKETWH
ncbi:Uncharacterized protein Rs2_09471 [Raphanus sativus]|nr:Uncharacterized protein Rs2_09471 [Raphanus sativus]